MSDQYFSDFDRNYPFRSEVIYNVIVSDFMLWSEQRRLRSSNPRRKFACTFFPLVRDEAEAIRDFFNYHKGGYESFHFVNPLDDVDYEVRFLQDELTIERMAYNTFRMYIELITVTPVVAHIRLSANDSVIIAENIQRA